MDADPAVDPILLTVHAGMDVATVARLLDVLAGATWVYVATAFEVRQVVAEPVAVQSAAVQATVAKRVASAVSGALDNVLEAQPDAQQPPDTATGDYACPIVGCNQGDMKRSRASLQGHASRKHNAEWHVYGAERFLSSALAGEPLANLTPPPAAEDAAVPVPQPKSMWNDPPPPQPAAPAEAVAPATPPAPAEPPDTAAQPPPPAQVPEPPAEPPPPDPPAPLQDDAAPPDLLLPALLTIEVGAKLSGGPRHRKFVEEVLDDGEAATSMEARKEVAAGMGINPLTAERWWGEYLAALGEAA